VAVANSGCVAFLRRSHCPPGLRSLRPLTPVASEARRPYTRVRPSDVDRMTITPSATSPAEATGGDVELPSEDSASAPESLARVQPPSQAPPALRQLVSELLDFVWRSLRRFGVPAADVDDATQQVFLIANDKLPKIHPGSERSFLVGVATRVASHVRR